MPFKLRLKKSRQYNVVSKSLFVCGVELLDGGSLECTLGSESTGKDCLDNVCQRLGLNQSEFFGLQYVPRSAETNNGPRWLEMDRPVKRQLDKYAIGPQLLLRVMFYVTCPVNNLLTDETSRYHYFLQLKTDVIEGRIATTPQQAVLLASYSMQAEFGNYDSERHTPEYLKDFQLFPKHLTDAERDVVDRLTETATLQHAALRGLPPGTAEERYIAACQQLDGYGQETFLARDQQNQDVVIGISLNGITVANENGNEESKFYFWKDISNVINHKKYFTIECTIPSNTVQYQFEDVECAKHVWRMCVHQHTFHTRLLQQHPTTSNANPTPSDNLINDEKPTETFENLHNLQIPVTVLPQRAQSTSCLDLSTDIEKLRALLPSYRAAPDYETAVQQKYRTAAAALRHQEPGRGLYSSQPEVGQSSDGYSPRLRYPDVTHNNIENAGALLHHHHLYPNITQARFHYNQPLRTAGSERQLQHYNIADLVEGMQLLHLYKPPPPYPSNRLSSNSTPDLAVASQRLNVPVHTFAAGQVSGSSPDLVSTRSVLNRQYLKHANNYEPQMTHGYLTNTHGTYENLASIIDNKHYIYDARTRQPAVIMENHEVTKHIQKIVDEHGNVIYCMPTVNHSYPRTSSGAYLDPPQQAAGVVEDPNEPIYENVPLPWQTSDEMRHRAESIQSAPEILPVLNHNLYNDIHQLPSSLRTSLQGIQSQQEDTMYANLQSQYIQEKEASNNNTFFNKSERNFKSSNSNINKTLDELDHIIQKPPSLQNLNSISATKQSTPTIVISQSNHQVPIPEPRNFTSALAHQSVATNVSKISTVPSKTSVTSSESKSKWNTSDNSIATNESFATSTSNNNTSYSMSTLDTSQSSTSSSKDKKRRRWGLLGGKSKEKSATLGREKEKTHNEEKARHRWSTGLPRLQPLPPTITKETMCQILERKLVDSQLFFEFEKIPKKKPNADFTTALLSENAARNRFKDVLPYEENRVRLAPTKENKYGYVNASHVTATVGNKQRFYIAAQGPSAATLEDFWHAVWQADVYLIVQLTAVHEDLRYVPSAPHSSLTVGQYQIWSEVCEESEHCATSKLRICNSQSRHYRSIWHVVYGLWGDQGCPAAGEGHFLTFLEELRSVREHSVAQDVPPGHNRNPPTLVHCTAGVGRTGVVLLCDLLLHALDYNQELDIARTLSLLRQQRAHLLQTHAQYRFVHSLLIHYLKQTRLI